MNRYFFCDQGKNFKLALSFQVARTEVRFPNSYHQKEKTLQGKKKEKQIFLISHTEICIKRD